jgi:hypothetical protein
MKNVVGQVATGDKFFDRPGDIKNLWQKIKNGSNILLSAPRRTGKTSILYKIKDFPESGYTVLYIDTESVDKSNEFFRKIYNLLLNECDDSIRKKFIEIAKGFGRRIEEIGNTVKLNDKELDYYEELLNLIRKTEFDNEKIVIIVDEFAETLQNIIKDDENFALSFLEKNRELRQNPDINEKIQFIYAGSIGLENVTDSINCSKFINDLNTHILKPLNYNEAKNFILFVLDGEDLLSNENIDYILQELAEYIPFFIQIIIEEISESDFSGTNNEIDAAFEAVIKKRSYFDHWHTRLRSYQQNEYQFAKSVLNIASEELLTSAVIYDKAVEFGVEDKYKAIVNALIYDGYLNNHENPSQYKFNSPLLKMWWCKNVAN